MKTFVSDLKPPFWWRTLSVGLHLDSAAAVLPACRSLDGEPVPIRLCETTPTDVVPAEYSVEELWAALDQTLQHSGCGVGSDTPVDQGGTLARWTHIRLWVPQHR